MAAITHPSPATCVIALYALKSDDMIKPFDDESLRVLSAANSATLFGNAAAVLSGCNRYNTASFADVAGFIATAIRHRQLKCYFDQRNHLVGAVAWMWLDKAVLRRVLGEPTFPPSIHISEWREGDIFFVPLLVAHRQSLADIMRDLQQDLPMGASAIAWINHRRNRLHVVPLGRALRWKRHMEEAEGPKSS